MSVTFPVGVSARHVHLTQEDTERLFGPGHKLVPVKPLTQPGEFSCAETVEVRGVKGSFPKIRVLGPVRSQTQVEISRSDSYVLGLDPPVRGSGDLKGSPGAVLIGPAGEVALSEGVIVAQRHLHLDPESAVSFGLKNMDMIKARLEGDRALVFENVLVRVSSKYKTDLHLDTDEANAAGARNGDTASLVE